MEIFRSLCGLSGGRMDGRWFVSMDFLDLGGLVIKRL